MSDATLTKYNNPNFNRNKCNVRTPQNTQCHRKHEEALLLYINMFDTVEAPVCKHHFDKHYEKLVTSNKSPTPQGAHVRSTSTICLPAEHFDKQFENANFQWDFEDYLKMEREMISLIESLGYVDIEFHSTEVDSFGPLSRVATMRKDGDNYSWEYD